MKACRLIGTKAFVNRMFSAYISPCGLHRTAISTCSLLNSNNFTSKQHYSSALHTKTPRPSTYQCYRHNDRSILTTPSLFHLNKTNPSILTHGHRIALMDMCHSSAKKERQTKDTGMFKRRISLSAKEIVDASPPKVQLYLRLCRVDRPIGKLTFLDIRP